MELEILILLILFLKKCFLESIIDIRNVVVVVWIYGNGGIVKVWLNEYEERGILINICLFFGYIKFIIIVC